MFQKDEIIKIFVSKSNNYKFLEKNAIYIIRHGSRAYNCHTESSDDDYKGFFINEYDTYFSMFDRYEHIEIKEPDASLYEIGKFFKMAVNCNPNVIETLFVDPCDQVYVSSIGEKILNNRNLFLSKKIFHTISGYAYAQMNKLKNHKKWVTDPIKLEPQRKDYNLPEKPLINKQAYDILKSIVSKEMELLNFKFLDNLTVDQVTEIKYVISDYLAKFQIKSKDLETNILYRNGLDDNFIQNFFKEKEYEAALNNYKNYLIWKKNRNPERALSEGKIGYDVKFAYHIIRLYRMCCEILETGKVIVRRPDRDDFIDIRNGKWSYEKLSEESDKLFAKSKYLYETSKVIPDHPDRKAINNLLLNCTKDFFKNDRQIYNQKLELETL